MKHSYYLLLFLGVALSTFAEPTLPKDVSIFLESREVCDQWRGKGAYYGDEKQIDINWAVCTTCTGTDAILKKLKQKYKSHKKVMSQLNLLETEVEPKDKIASKKFCKETRHSRGMSGDWLVGRIKRNLASLPKEEADIDSINRFKAAHEANPYHIGYESLTFRWVFLDESNNEKYYFFYIDGIDDLEVAYVTDVNDKTIRYFLSSSWGRYID